MEYLNRGTVLMTNKELLSFKVLFQGIVVRSWLESDMKNLKDFKYNKVIIKEYVHFYIKC